MKLPQFRFLIAILVECLSAVGAEADGAQPLFDTHLYYCQPTWQFFITEEIFSLLKKAGVVKALVSSTPDNGTLKLCNLREDVIVPSLRPYRRVLIPPIGLPQQTTFDYLTGWLKKGIYKAVGEFHLFELLLPLIL